MLWLYDENWRVVNCHIGTYKSLNFHTYRPEFIHPFASAIDSPDLTPPETMTCVKLNSKPQYVRLPEGKKETYDNYGPHSIEEWHKKNNLFVE